MRWRWDEKVRLARIYKKLSKISENKLNAGKYNKKPEMGACYTKHEKLTCRVADKKKLLYLIAYILDG